jgi:hypothetical protein
MMAIRRIGDCRIREPGKSGEDTMTYYRVEFVGVSEGTPRAKRFRTKESAQKHAKRVLGAVDDSSFDSKVLIVAISRNGVPVDEL